MKKAYDFLHRKEKGNVIVLFALTLVILVIFMGLSIDFGLMYSKRNHLIEVGQLAREARFGELPYIMQADDPNAALNDVVKRCVVENGIPEDQFSTVFRDTRLTHMQRTFTIDIYLWDTYEFTFLKIFGIKQQEIRVHINGGGTVSRNNPAAGVWSPYI